MAYFSITQNTRPNNQPDQFDVAPADTNQILSNPSPALRQQNSLTSTRYRFEPSPALNFSSSGRVKRGRPCPVCPGKDCCTFDSPGYFLIWMRKSQPNQGQLLVNSRSTRKFETPALSWLGLPLAKEFSFELYPDGGQLWATRPGTYHTRPKLKSWRFGWKPSERLVRIPTSSMVKASAILSQSLSHSEAGGR